VSCGPIVLLILNCNSFLLPRNEYHFYPVHIS
jgi:hypothetical protein